MKDIYKIGRTCVYHINYHIAWTVKYRRKVLDQNISEFLKQDLKEICESQGFDFITCEVGTNDHVHIFLSAHPKHSISKIVKALKGISGHHLFMEYPEIKTKLWKGHLWNDSYFVETIGSTSTENITKYINRQNNHQI